MILADKIINERKKNGWSQEEFAEKLSVSRQAVSKWESAQSVPDLQRVIQMAQIFGVTTDYLLKDEIEEITTEMNVEAMEPEENLQRVSMEEANAFLNLKKTAASKIADGVSFCIICPTLLIFLDGMASSFGKLSEGVTEGIGLIFLFACVAWGVYNFIVSGISLSKVEHLEKEVFETEYGVTGMVKEKKNAFEPDFIRGIALGVVLCIVAVIPVIITGVMEAPDYVTAGAVVMLFCLIAWAVHMIVRVAIVKDSFDTLLQEGDYSKAEKKTNKKMDPIVGAYWSIVTAGYLAWSFWTMRWDMTWIVWPVAAVLFAAVNGILRAFIHKD